MRQMSLEFHFSDLKKNIRRDVGPSIFLKTNDK